MFKKGHTTWNKGLKNPFIITDEYRKKCSEAHKGQNTWSKGRKLSKEHVEKLKEARRKNPSICMGFLGRKHTDEAKEKIRLSSTGRIHSKDARDKISRANGGENNGQWKGDKVSYAALHEWVRKYYVKTEVCEICKEAPPRDLANISQKYLRDLNDWEWLCRRCHMKKDGRMENLINNFSKRYEKRRKNSISPL